MRGTRSSRCAAGQKVKPKKVKLFERQKTSGKHVSAQQAKIISMYYPALRYFRSLRLSRFYSSFDITDSTRIIDVGGNIFFWRLAKEMEFPEAQVTVVNLDTPRKNADLPANLEWIYGNGTDLQFADNSFDIVFCNSVIEHLGDRQTQNLLVKEINRIAPCHFVQTPNRRFLFEPHLMAFFVHFLPLKLEKMLLRNFTGWGLIQRPSRQECEELMRELRLLTVSEMKSFFPDSKIISERFMGLTKSIIAVKAPGMSRVH